MLGLSSLAQILEQCRYRTFMAGVHVCDEVDRIRGGGPFGRIKSWIQKNGITDLGFSYRLDPAQGLEIFGRLVRNIKNDPDLFYKKGGNLRNIYFAGLPDACQLVEREFNNQFITFQGDETPGETLKKLGIPLERIPRAIQENSVYDDLRLDFGKKMINNEMQYNIYPYERYEYDDFGTTKDNLITRLKSTREAGILPLFRAHVGPYDPDREKALTLFSVWLKKLAQSRYLDIVSVGSSQLSQSHFGEDWGDLPNGGGVPFNNEFELRAIREDAAPMLVRAYSGTKNVADYAKILDDNLNNAWHALSFWWFNKIDGRGPLSVRQGLNEHLQALEYIADIGKPFEPNIPHHFAFRGADDFTYIVSAYLAAKTAKKMGIKYLVLQNMLNTPKSTWGVRDLAKARAMLRLVRELENDNFKVIYQPRAGLDYFSPDMEKAKIQLAAVTALMMDVEPHDPASPEIIHVVSYSEAFFLADPDIIDESIRITRAALRNYPEFRRSRFIHDIITSRELADASEELYEGAKRMVKDMEGSVQNLFSPEGLFQVFRNGYFPVPYLWEGRKDLSRAVSWDTRQIDGGVWVVDDKGRKIEISDRLDRVHEMMER
ncbi:MAG: cobalamin-binding protein [Candidatus Aminicenantes bacterium]|nr:cobalamin-binding protein [Candidatus Aminicenantes bacterium]